MVLLDLSLTYDTLIMIIFFLNGLQELVFPQGSVLAPMRFSLHMLPLSQITIKYLLSFYTANIQLYFSFKPSENDHSMSILLECLPLLSFG